MMGPEEAIKCLQMIRLMMFCNPSIPQDKVHEYRESIEMAIDALRRESDD